MKAEVDIDPLSIINYNDNENNTTSVAMNKWINVNTHGETKIEIVEDFVLKTETSALSEFIDLYVKKMLCSLKRYLIIISSV